MERDRTKTTICPYCGSADIEFCKIADKEKFSDEVRNIGLKALKQPSQPSLWMILKTTLLFAGVVLIIIMSWYVIINLYGYDDTLGSIMGTYIMISFGYLAIGPLVIVLIAMIGYNHTKASSRRKKWETSKVCYQCGRSFPDNSLFKLSTEKTIKTV